MLQNSNSGNTSYAGFVVGNNTYNPNGLAGNIEIGTNSSTYSYAAAGYPNNSLSLANGSWVETANGDMTIATWSTNPIHFVVNGGASTADSLTIATNGYVGVNTQTPNATLTVNGSFSATGVTSESSVFELTTNTASAPVVVTNFDVMTQGVQYYTSNNNTNFAVNVRGNSTTTLNSILNIGQTVTIAMLTTNGATPYYLSACQVDGTVTAAKWQGGTAPTSGHANSLDVYTLSVTKTSNTPSYTILASQAQFA